MPAAVPPDDLPTTSTGNTPSGDDGTPEIRVWHNGKIVYRLPADGLIVFDDVAVPLGPDADRPDA